MSAKSEIQLDNLGLNIYCHTTSSLFIFVKVSVFKKGKDVKYVLYLILSIFLQVLQRKIVRAVKVHIYRKVGDDIIQLCGLLVLQACPQQSVVVRRRCIHVYFSLLKPTGHLMHQQSNIQQLYVLPTLYLCVLYLPENGPG